MPLNSLCFNNSMKTELNVNIAAETLDGLYGEWLRRSLVKQVKELGLLPEDFASNWLLWEEYPAITAANAAKVLRRVSRDTL